jgi:hypothetical protein
METRSRDVPKDTARWDLPPDRKLIRKFFFLPQFSYVGVVVLGFCLMAIIYGSYWVAAAIFLIGSLIDAIGAYSLGKHREP